MAAADENPLTRTAALPLVFDNFFHDRFVTSYEANTAIWWNVLGYVGYASCMNGLIPCFYPLARVSDN
jgi:hypothetical protein